MSAVTAKLSKKDIKRGREGVRVQQYRYTICPSRQAIIERTDDYI